MTHYLPEQSCGHYNSISKKKKKRKQTLKAMRKTGQDIFKTKKDIFQDYLEVIQREHICHIYI